MRVSVITPTADQPIGIGLLEGYVASQTVQPFQWIVADDGDKPASLTMGQHHIVRERTLQGGASLALNMLSALDAVTGDYVVIMEHDDYYSPGHIAHCIGIDSIATGASHIRYYHVDSRMWIRLRSRGSALCCTAFRAEAIPIMQAAAESCLKTGAISLDRSFWRQVNGEITDSNTVVGIKGLPGRKGLGMGHNPANSWTPDPKMITLSQWIGKDAAAVYANLH